MFDDIYDNGCVLLGKQKNLIEYMKKHYIDNNYLDYLDDVKEIIKSLQELKPDTIVAINYDNPMGWTIEYWTYEDKKDF